MKNKNEQISSMYTSFIEKGKLLTRLEEQALIKNIEVYQKEILNEIISFPYSRYEFVSFLSNLQQTGDIVDISRKLDEESSKVVVDLTREAFNKLIESSSRGDLDETKRLLEEVSLTGTIIHGIVVEIKKKRTLILDAESQMSQISKYFDKGTTFEKIIQVIVDKDLAFLAKVQKDYQLNDVKMENKVKEWSFIISQFLNVVKQMPAGFLFSDVKQIYSKIYVLEHKASTYKNELIERNLRLVVSRAAKFTGKGLDLEDLIQEGNIGLMKAVDKFDSSRKTKVSTYATWWIDQSVRRAISNKGKIVRVPTHIEWMETKLAQLRVKMLETLRREPTIQELADESGYSLETINEVKTRANHPVSLDGDDDSDSASRPYSETLPSDEPSPFQHVSEKMMKESVRKILATLSPRAEKIIRLRFGIGELPDAEGTTLQSIADDIGLTKQGVRVVECAALTLLKKKAKGMNY